MTITNGNRKVSIRTNDGSFFAILIVNANEQDGGDVVASRSFSTLKGAKRWAQQQIES